MSEKELNKYGEAAAAFKRALELDPDNSSYYERLYSLYDAMRLEEAADSLAMEMAVRFPRKFRTPYLLMRLGNRAWLTEHNDSLALRYYEEALAIDGEYPAALYGKAEVSRDMHESNEPVFLTRNGVGDMVVMSMEAYEDRAFDSRVADAILEAEQQARLSGESYSIDETLALLRGKQEPVA